jgi:hypothetical protein
MHSQWPRETTLAVEAGKQILAVEEFTQQPRVSLSAHLDSNPSQFYPFNLTPMDPGEG